MPDKATGSQDSQNWLLLVLNHPIFSDPIMKAAPVGLKIRAFQKKNKVSEFQNISPFHFPWPFGKSPATSFGCVRSPALRGAGCAAWHRSMVLEDLPMP
jgi:hypothetical protein